MKSTNRIKDEYETMNVRIGLKTQKALWNYLARRDSEADYIWLGKVMRWHGSWCPAWKAWEKVYGESETAKTRKR